MELIADALLIAGAAGAALYCRALARRIEKLKNLDSGLGAAIGALSRQVDDLRASLDEAKHVSGDRARDLSQLAARAEMAAGRLELLLASLHEDGRRAPARKPPRYDGGETEGPADAPSAADIAAAVALGREARRGAGNGQAAHDDDWREIGGAEGAR